MKKRLAILCLALAAVLLTGCAPKAAAPAAVTTLPGQPTQAPAMDLATSVPLPEGVDPSGEEDKNPEYVADVGAAVQPTGLSQFAGSTPIPLDPIDMPTPTNHPPLVFTYETYTATNIGLSFESVAGYEVDATQADAYILTEPAAQQKDNYSVQITFTLSTVTANYKASNIRADLRAKMDELGKLDYQTWSPSSAASRTLLNAEGYYATYRGVKTDGTIVRGRVHMALLPGNKLLTIHLTDPAEYNLDYEGVFTRIRSTLKKL
ncbi:MAG: hypothetical protein AB9880_04750 [Christensenellales bacterium]